MTVSQTQTAPQTNGDETYSPKFLPTVMSIPIVNSLKKQLFIHVPQAEAVTKFVGDHLTAAFNYTNDTPIQHVLIKLDTLAANGVTKLEKEVPIVNTPTDEVIKKTKVDALISFLTHWYVLSISFVSNIFAPYKDAFDKTFDSLLDRVETFIGLKDTKPSTFSERVNRIGGVLIDKADSRVTPILNQMKEAKTSIYNKVARLFHYPLKEFETQKDKASEIPIVQEITSRVSKAETAAKKTWTETKPDVAGSNSFIPTVKSGIFTVIAFAYTLVSPEEGKSAPKGLEEQINGLASGVEFPDGNPKKRLNGPAS